MQGDFPAYANVREKMDKEFDEAVFLPGCGVGHEEVSRRIRAVYDKGRAEGEPFIVTRAKMVAAHLEGMRIAVNDFDPFAHIVERQYGCLPFFPNEIVAIRDERGKAAFERDVPRGTPLREALERAARDCRASCGLDTGHTAPDWGRVLALGIPGLLRRAEALCRERPSPFAEAVRIVYAAGRDYLVRYADVAGRGGRADLAEVFRALAARAPRTLREALQLLLSFRDMQEIEGEWVRSMGIFDRLMLPFYERDLAEGRLTPDSAQNLLALFFARFHARSRGRDAGTPFCFGGRLPGGDDAPDGCNALTRMAWKAQREIGQPDPKFALRVNPETPDDVLLLIAENLREGKTATVFANEDVMRDCFRRNGKDEADLPDIVPIGCYEPAVMGKELSCTCSAFVNLAKLVEDLFADPAFAPATFGDVTDRYLELLRESLSLVLEADLFCERAWPEVNPSPLLSGTMDECMASGRDVSEGGSKYATTGVVCVGIGTAADSLAAIRQVVFERKDVSFRALGEILAADWAGHERLREEVCARAPKWGCGDVRADRLAKAIVDAAGRQINGTPNAKGGRYQMALWSIDFALSYGARTGATPDGRRRGAPLSKNAGSAIGCDREGVAGLMESVCKLDHALFGDGTVLDVMLAPRTVAGPEGAAFLVGLVRGFFAQGGMFVHFNILSPETLREAQRDPARYRNLQIRLCGWNVRFVDLSRPAQDCLIREAESKGA